MAGSVLEETKLTAQSQMVQPVYEDGPKLNLRENNGCDFNRGLKRGRLEIKAEILCCCSKERTKTRIMYNVNLNYAQLKKQLKSLTANGLLEVNKNMYTTTEKGYRFIELFVELNGILDSY